MENQVKLEEANRFLVVRTSSSAIEVLLIISLSYDHHQIKPCVQGRVMVLEKECEERRKNQSEHEVEIKIIKRERNQQMDSLARVMIDNERLKVSSQR